MCGSRRWHATRTVGPWPSGSRSQARHWHVRATVRRPVVAVAERRLLGIDLGVTTAHTVESLEAVEAAALRGTPAGTRLEVVVEPTGAAWLPVAVFFAGRGHTVFRVPSAKAADLRRFLSRHAKSIGSTPRRWPGCRWSTRAACSRWSCPAVPGRTWTGGCGPASG